MKQQPLFAATRAASLAVGTALAAGLGAVVLCIAGVW